MCIRDRPIARQDHKSVNEILAATDFYYKKIGIIYAISIVVLAVSYTHLDVYKRQDQTGTA